MSNLDPDAWAPTGREARTSDNMRRSPGTPADRTGSGRNDDGCVVGECGDDTRVSGLRQGTPDGVQRVPDHHWLVPPG